MTTTKAAHPGFIEALCSRVEKAIDAHPLLIHRETMPIWLRWSRDGATMHAMVKLRGSRKIRPDDITGSGETPDEAADKLIATLDQWAATLRSS